MVADEFDITSCQELAGRPRLRRADAAFLAGRAASSRYAQGGADLGQHRAAPDPDAEPRAEFRQGAAARRCWSFPEDAKIVILGTGGLSHQLDGQRAGFINKEFDQYCLENIVHNPEELTKITRMELVEKAGAQGTEFLMWMMMRGALGDDVTEITRNYHIPISNTAAGTLLLECAA